MASVRRRTARRQGAMTHLGRAVKQPRKKEERVNNAKEHDEAGPAPRRGLPRLVTSEGFIKPCSALCTSSEACVGVPRAFLLRRPSHRGLFASPANFLTSGRASAPP